MHIHDTTTTKTTKNKNTTNKQRDNKKIHNQITQIYLINASHAKNYTTKTVPNNTQSKQTTMQLLWQKENETLKTCPKENAKKHPQQ